MVEQKIVWASGITALITAIVILGGIQITDNKTYGCEERDIFMECDSLSTYYGLPNGKCINIKLGNKLCRTGWTKDFKVVNEEEQPVIRDIQNVLVIAYVNNEYGGVDKFFCDSIGINAKCIKDDGLLMPFG